MKKFGPQIQAHLKEGERLLDATFAIALKNPPKGYSKENGGSIVATGDTAGRLLNEMPQRTPGVTRPGPTHLLASVSLGVHLMPSR